MEVVSLTPEEFAQPDGARLPDESIMLGIKNATGKLLTRTALVPLAHIEGTWVDPGCRGGILGFKTVRALEDMVRKLGKTHVIAFVPDETVADYMSRMGYVPIPVTVWAKELR